MKKQAGSGDETGGRFDTLRLLQVGLGCKDSLNQKIWFRAQKSLIDMVFISKIDFSENWTRVPPNGVSRLDQKMVTTPTRFQR